MRGEIIKFAQPMQIEEVVKQPLDISKALGWGVQSMTKGTVDAMVLLASSRTDAYRFALAVSPDIGDYLIDLPIGSVTSNEYFKCVPEIKGSLIGTAEGSLEVHRVEEDDGNSYLALLTLNDDKLVDGYVITRLRTPDDHVVKNILPNRKDV